MSRTFAFKYYFQQALNNRKLYWNVRNMKAQLQSSSAAKLLVIIHYDCIIIRYHYKHSSVFLFQSFPSILRWLFVFPFSMEFLLTMCYRKVTKTKAEHNELVAIVQKTEGRKRILLEKKKASSHKIEHRTSHYYGIINFFCFPLFST